jgi:hypothetical protein
MNWSEPDSRAPRTLAPLLLAGLAALACSCDGGSPPPTPAPTSPQASPGKEADKKTAKLRPGAQVPGSGDYEDKPGTRGRGR